MLHVRAVERPSHLWRDSVEADLLRDFRDYERSVRVATCSGALMRPPSTPLVHIRTCIRRTPCGAVGERYMVRGARGGPG
eukprot:15471029-Alexandrium_andersonii.AAC.1